jgi:hypothetical protein
MDRFSVTQAIQPKTNDDWSPACFNRGTPGHVGPNCCFLVVGRGRSKTRNMSTSDARTRALSR